MPAALRQSKKGRKDFLPPNLVVGEMVASMETHIAEERVLPVDWVQRWLQLPKGIRRNRAVAISSWVTQHKRLRRRRPSRRPSTKRRRQPKPGHGPRWIRETPGSSGARERPRTMQLPAVCCLRVRPSCKPPNMRCVKFKNVGIIRTLTACENQGFYAPVKC